MKSVEQCACDEVLRPDHARWLNEKASTYAGETETRKLCGDHEQCTEPVAGLEIVVHLCNDDGVDGVRSSYGYVCHDVYQYVFLDVPWPWVKRQLETAQPTGEAISGDGKNECEELSHGITDDDESERRDVRSRLSEIEEDVHRPADQTEKETDDPHAEGHDGHIWVINI